MLDSKCRYGVQANGEGWAGRRQRPRIDPPHYHPFVYSP